MIEAIGKKVSSEFKLRRIKCPSCGASISMIGGHNVSHVVCSYCNSCLEIGQDIKLAYKNKKTLIPSKPLKIGQKGKIRGVNYAVIGLVKYEEKDEDGVYPWLEYLLFSPTHGYVWLCYEECHWVLVHEIKDVPNEDIQIIPEKSSFQFRGKTFKVFEKSNASIAYLEGELTWDAEIGDNIYYIDSICPPYMLCAEKRAGEFEFSYGEYIYADEIKEAFGFDTPTPSKVGACQPVGFKYGCALTKAGCLSAIIAFVLSFIFSTSGTTIASFNLPIGLKQDTYISEPVMLDDIEKVYAVEMRTPKLDNSWAFADIQVIDEKEEYKITNHQLDTSFYWGYEDGEKWTEGSKKVNGYFKIPEAGKYKFVIEGGGNVGETNTESETFNTIAYFTIRKGARSAKRVNAFGFLLGFLSLLYAVWYAFKDGSRWSDNDDDDD